MKLSQPMLVLGAAGCAGLFVARLLSEIVPDALAIGVSAFAAGALGGFCAGVLVRRDQHAHAARTIAGGLERTERILHRHDHEE
jgi:hypothetical protein